MAQTFQARRLEDANGYIQHTPVGAISAGAPVVIGSNLVTVADTAIAAGALGDVSIRGTYNIVIKNESFSAGDAFYWDEDGDPYNGTSGTGAGTATGSAGPFAGWVQQDATGGTDEFARVLLRSMEDAAAESLGLADLSDVGTVIYTAGRILVADGDSYEDVAVSGAITLAATGVATINPDTELGASGTAGSMTVYPTTAASGKTVFAATDNAGDTTTNVTTAAQSGARTYTTPDAGASADYVMDEGAQTLGGLKDFTLMPLIPPATVAATGSIQGDAAAITTGFTKVTAADATKAILLPAATGGQVCFIANVVAQTLPIFPASGDSINEIAVNSALTIAASVSVILVSYDDTEWYSFPLLAS